MFKKLNINIKSLNIDGVVKKIYIYLFFLKIYYIFLLKFI